MALLKSGVDAFVARPDPARAIVLLFGPDDGLVSERAETIVLASVDDPRDLMAVMRIAGDELAADPARLADEALSIPMFGGRRVIWVRAGSRNFVSALEALIKGGQLRETRIVIEAGDLKKSAPLRALGERNPAVTAIPCYVDTAQDLAKLIDEEMRAANLKISSEARTALAALLGGDRRASRGEIQKLATYAHGRGEVTLDDVAAVVGDSSSWAMDELIDAAFAKQPRQVEALFGKALEEGGSPGGIIFAAARQCAQLHRARLNVEGGTPVEDAIGPQIFFKRKRSWEQALRAWDAARLAKMIVDLGDLGLAVRQNASLSTAYVHRALLQIASAKK
ncbi:DNA polymerase III subunit delta [Variibacter gotjawalensis]|uniref:DNA-directed DNA polymerase n=1 Tax=Variibacter gotjawalensis TaxID=1333996 RepID=A0A0S3PQJ8_9BRAD|nr:DNA polymerase III subunit delta [Variibacter gotjawalensis]NIK48519.1 DNA polymerase-3 subunit delta [Variibacter gotjawalensis]RZS50384.1 DNA polymerase III delta subunit [Variibacter gotjawalensis]BAT58219.1 DNA polymerase III subunit delta [Variibacter gotjawalensis]